MPRKDLLTAVGVAALAAVGATGAASPASATPAKPATASHSSPVRTAAERPQVAVQRSAPARPARSEPRVRRRYDAVPATVLRHRSSNWAGYSQGSGEIEHRVTSVSGSWIVPTASPLVRGQEEAGATWVGVGGACITKTCSRIDPTLIQAGTTQRVGRNGRPSYFSWYEVLPAISVRTPLAVHSGDSMSVAIQRVAPARWTIRMRNGSTGRSWATPVSYRSRMGSAEWIEEQPQQLTARGRRAVPMPRQSRVHFSSARVNGGNAHLLDEQRITMVSSGKTLATASSPGRTHDSFSVCTHSASCQEPAHK